MELKQLASESNEHFQIFNHYVKTGFGRSITDLADTFNLSRKQIHRLSNQHDWKKRVLDYDEQHLTRIRETYNSEYQENMNVRRHVVVDGFGKAQNVAKKMLDYDFKYTSNEMPADEFLAKTDKYFSILLKYERLSEKWEGQINRFGLSDKADTEIAFSELESLDKEVDEFIKSGQKIENNETFSDILSPTKFEMPDISKNEEYELTQTELEQVSNTVDDELPTKKYKQERKDYREYLIKQKKKEKILSKMSEEELELVS